MNGSRSYALCLLYYGNIFPCVKSDNCPTVHIFAASRQDNGQYTFISKNGNVDYLKKYKPMKPYCTFVVYFTCKNFPTFN